MDKEKVAVFMLGLPGAGKSTYLDKNYPKGSNHILVSADEIRVNHPNYDPKFPEAIHEECIALAEQSMYDIAENYVITNMTGDIVMDGGGINNSYTLRILLKMKSYGFKTKVVFIDTPTQVCIDRNNLRIQNGERFVPSETIIDKAYRLKKSIDKLKLVCDEFIRVPYFTNEHVFFDMDGTLAEYQNFPVDEDKNVNFVGYEVFKYSNPVEDMIYRAKVLKNVVKKNVYIISASPNSICNGEKQEWLNKHCDFIENKNRYFVGNKNFKHVFLKQLMLKLKIKPHQCMVVDDDHHVLNLYRTIGVNTVHPSAFQANPINEY